MGALSNDVRRPLKELFAGKMGAKDTTPPFLFSILPKSFQKLFKQKYFTLVLTFFAYMSYHLSRKPISVVKPVLNRNCSDVSSNGNHNQSIHPNDSCWCCWDPFDQDNAKELLGDLDYAYLFAYAIAMFFSGYIGERVNLRYFLTFGMISSGIFTALMGMAYFEKIHSMTYFVIIQVLGGLVQSTGWPSVVEVVGNWFGKGRRGLIMGIWNSHTSVGNILGSVIAAAFVDDQWGWSFIVPGIIIAFFGIVIFLFLVVHPNEVGVASPSEGNVPETQDTQKVKLLNSEKNVKDGEKKAISIWSAFLIPGVIEFSFCLFFAKLVSYTFLYWLPTYINKSTKFSPGVSADLSTLFDVGGIVGGILAGLISDRLNGRALTCMGSLVLGAPLMFLYHSYGDFSYPLNVCLLIICGILINGPYALITTAVAADLGTHPSLHNNSKALATVTAIIDGTGSIGAAIGPLLTGLITDKSRNWDNVFYMLIGADIAACLLLSRLGFKELMGYIRPNKQEYAMMSAIKEEDDRQPLLSNYQNAASEEATS